MSILCIIKVSVLVPSPKGLELWSRTTVLNCTLDHRRVIDSTEFHS
jgi:hypothetical protein